MEFSPEQLELRKTVTKVQSFLNKNFSEEERDKLFKNDQEQLGTIREMLDAFRAHVGGEHYAALAAGGSFGEMLDRWLRQRRDDVIEKMWNRLQKMLPEKEKERISKEEFRQFLIVIAVS